MKSKVDGMNKEALFLIGLLKGLGKLLALKAVYYSVKAHGSRLRDDKVSRYFEHPIRVCRMFLYLGIRDDATLAASLLHDVVEDGHATLEEIRGIFGEEVAFLVDLVTKRENEAPDVYYKRVASDIRAILIKAVDRVCNVDDMIEVFDAPRLRRYVLDTEMRVLPMMKDTRRVYLEYTDILILCRDYIKGILKAAKKVLRLYEKVANLETELAKKKSAIKKPAKRSKKKGLKKPKNRM